MAGLETAENSKKIKKTWAQHKGPQTRLRDKAFL